MAESTPERVKPIREPSYLDALIPLIALMVLIGGAVLLFGVDAVDGPIPVALVLCVMVAELVVLKNGHHWDDVVRSSKIAFASIETPVFILLSVGALIGTWNMSGTIPTLIYYGINVLQPGYFYVATLVLCALVSLSIGSSWTTAGTVGVGLVGLASLLGVSPAVTAGAVISGSYLGDKLSPLSETTVLTSQLVGIDIYTHLRAQIWTSVPAFLIAALVFVIMGLRVTVSPEADTGSEIKQLDQLFWITPWNLIPLAVLIVLSVRRVPPALAIMASALLAAAMAPILQHDSIVRFINDESVRPPAAYLKAAWLAIAHGYEANSGIPVLDRLLSRGGMDSMLTTLWIIIGAVTFGTILDEFKLLSKLIDPLLRRARNTGGLVGSVVGTAFGLNLLAGDQYIALVLPARLFASEFGKRGLAPATLSRACADGGTVTSAIVPWNSCGAYMAATLGIPTMTYLPFCLFNIASPLFSVLWGILGFKVGAARAGSPAPTPSIVSGGPEHQHRHT